jgi:hypothetical protein
VQEIMIDYEQSTSFGAPLAGYRRSLGPPAFHVQHPDPERAERIGWRDDRTSFELVRDPRRSVSTVYARLTDRTVARPSSPAGEAR